MDGKNSKSHYFITSRTFFKRKNIQFYIFLNFSLIRINSQIKSFNSTMINTLFKTSFKIKLFFQINLCIK